MLIVHVFVHVKNDRIEEFVAATRSNAENSRLESGIARFDVVQQQDDASRFVLVEAYYTPEDALKHKETVHYQIWRDTVADMMAEPRSSIKYTHISPEPSDWA